MLRNIGPQHGRAIRQPHEGGDNACSEALRRAAGASAVLLLVLASVAGGAPARPGPVERAPSSIDTADVFPGRAGQHGMPGGHLPGSSANVELIGELEPTDAFGADRARPDRGSRGLQGLRVPELVERADLHQGRLLRRSTSAIRAIRRRSTSSRASPATTTARARTSSASTRRRSPATCSPSNNEKLHRHATPAAASTSTT